MLTLTVGLLALGLSSSPAIADSNKLEAYAKIIKEAPVRDSVDEKDGFRDVKFGQQCSTTPGFEHKKKLGDLTGYVRASDSLDVGPEKLQGIVYLCVDDSLKVVMFLANKDHDHATGLPLALKSTYGEPSIKESGLLYWRGSKRTAWVIERDDGLLAAMGDYPWADPVGLAVTVYAGAAQQGKDDL